LRTSEGKHFKIAILAGLTALTLATHYGWVVEPIFGHVHWFHALHGRFCYIPIIVAASWFGLRGGLVSATTISVLLLPFIFSGQQSASDLAAELVEIVFYYFIAVLTGALIDRELKARRRRQEAEIQVERSQKLALAGQIAAGVAHEIKNPLASIKGAADIITDDRNSPEERREFKDILQKEVRRIDSTVTEFLTFARPRETKLEVLDLSDAVRACVKQATSQAKTAGIPVHSLMEEKIFVKGDSEKLHQMTLNLILNALHASKQGAPVEVNLTLVNPAMARLVVSDTGAGMSEETLSRAFEPFFSTRATGTGLGLAIVKSMVDDHLGKISLKSELNMGTTATIELPAWKAAGEEG